MTLMVNIKQIGQKKQRVEPVPFEIEKPPATVGELITLTVKACVNAYNKRLAESGNMPRPLTAQKITDLADIGKIAFEINYGEKQADTAKAIENALQAYEDGIFRVFINDSELGKADEKIEIKNKDILTFIKLTLLAGRMY